MPTYDYVCSSCNNVSEKIVTIANRDKVDDLSCNVCPEVGTLNRIVAAPLVAYSVSVNGGYGSKVPDGFREILKRVHSLPGAHQNSSFL